MARQEITQLTSSRSSRNGVKPAIMVLHTTEGHNRPGVSDLTGLASFFNNVEASSHKGVDAEGNRITMVPDAEKAWTQASFNPQALSIEQVAFASFSKRVWIKEYTRGLDETAEILAEWHIKYGIPLRLSTSHGVCEHRHLGAAGGGHTDCGSGYPFRYVLYLARLKAWRMGGRKRKGKLRAAFYKRRVLRQQKRYGVKNPTTIR